MNTNINLIEEELELEELEEDLVHTVIDSLRNHHTDYCFSNKDFKSILSLAKEAGIGLIYKIFKDRYDELDYVEFIPANFYVSVNGKKTYIDEIYQFEASEVPENWKYDKERKEKGTGKSYKKTRKTIDYMAMAQGKEYLF